MRRQIFQGEPIHNTFYYLSGILQILGIVLIILVVCYATSKIYKFFNQIRK